MGTDEQLLSGLRNNTYQLAVVHEQPEGNSLACKRCFGEHLYIAVASNHPLATRRSACFADLQGDHILMAPNIGFWMDICLSHLPAKNLLVQSSWEALGELVHGSNLPVFTCDALIKKGIVAERRVPIPLSDEDAIATYWLVCRTESTDRYRPVFDATCA